MKIFVDTGKIEEIKKANEMGVICGVTTNPSLRHCLFISFLYFVLNSSNCSSIYSLHTGSCFCRKFKSFSNGIQRASYSYTSGNIHLLRNTKFSYSLRNYTYFGRIVHIECSKNQEI